MINVKEVGASGNGINDDSEAIQKALDIGGEIYIPSGDYRVKNTLKIGSDTVLTADKNARIFHCEQVKKRRGDFLLTNADFEKGNSNIIVCGGIWDGNFDGKNNTKPANRYDKNGWSGSVISFFNVKNLKLADMRVTNSVVYNMRFCCVDGFEIKNIEFSARERSFNQDGLHFNGCCKNGIVENIRAVTKGQTNDDLVGLNCDDVFHTVENMDFFGGDIENISFSKLYAEDCHTLIRILSIDHSVRNITFSDIYAGIREFAFNMDGSRYCMDPLFDESEYPQGSGNIENVRIDNFTAYVTDPERKCPLIDCETRTKNLVINGFKRLIEKEKPNSRVTLEAKNLVDTKIICGEREYYLKDKTDILKTDDVGGFIKIN